MFQVQSVDDDGRIQIDFHHHPVVSYVYFVSSVERIVFFERMDIHDEVDVSLYQQA